jgi:hypothetical protein
MSIIIDLPRKPLGGVIQTLRSQFGSLIAGKADLLILCAFVAAGLIVTLAATLLSLWTGSLADPALELARI